MEMNGLLKTTPNISAKTLKADLILVGHGK
jgi:hypothetical protein